MSVALLVMTDGREEYLRDCIESVRLNIDPAQLAEWWMFDDTGDHNHRNHLRRLYPEYQHINAGNRAGFGGAIRAAWQTLAARSRAEWVFHLEQDFVLNRPLDLAAMIEVMTCNARIVQMALRRQAWSAAETAAGGVVEQFPLAYVDVADGAGHQWLEHRQFFTTNPSLYRRWLCDMPWPTGPQSEGHFTHQLIASGAPGIPADALTFAYWGPRTDTPWVQHIGQKRVGCGY